MFKKINAKADFNAIELNILEFWNKNQIFEKSLELRKKGKVYYFYDGPPFATGLPHYGHILAGTIKDVIPRFRSMQGYYVERKFGWDCHGLPVEFEAEKELKLKGKFDIEKYGIANFNEYCRSIVLRYAKEWRKMVNRMARWVDTKSDYKTMDLTFMETIWWVFDRLYQDNLIYLNKKVVPYSARLNTPLSNFEVNLGYRMVQDPSIVIKFQLSDAKDCYFLVWTTTPWTLPSNFAVTVDPNLDYSLIAVQGEKYYLASVAIDRIFKGVEYKVLKSVKGKELEKLSYQPLYDYFKSYGKDGKAFFVTVADYVDSQTGTGIVHCAPSFGEDDFNTGQKYGLPLVMPFDDSGYFIDPITEYKGLFFKDADPKIIAELKSRNLLVKNERIEHSYPFCWRSDTPLMYRIIDSWFVNIDKIKGNLLKNNEKINWQPSHVGSGRMGKWLENARDWAISRNRYWGSTIPVWICQNCKSHRSFGSIAALEQASGEKIHDLHRHFIDHIELKCEKCSGKMIRTPEVLDCWFESGSMPYGERHYPFENREEFDKAFPADFVSEGLDQTRGWFYTLLVLSTALWDKPAFKNCVVSGLILADDGQKMSKRLKNYPDPDVMIKEFGADTIRLYMLQSGAVKAEELKFSKQGLLETIRGHIIPLWNVLNFFVTYANLDGFNHSQIKELTEIKLENNLDRWIVSRLMSILKKVEISLNEYKLMDAIDPLLNFNDELTNWYLRRSRRRFWNDEKISENETSDKIQAYTTTYHVLMTLAKMLAPIVPFISDEIYQVLKSDKDRQSVHLCDYPKYNQNLIDENLEKAMTIVMDTASLGRKLRASQKIKLRQPLNSASLVSKDPKLFNLLQETKSLLLDELNVKKINIENDEQKLVSYSARPNLPVIGKKYRDKIPQIKELLNKVPSESYGQLLHDGTAIKLNIDDSTIELNLDDLIIDRNQKTGILSESLHGVTVSIDSNLTAELITEGLYREVQNRIQNARKELNLDVAAKIDLIINCGPELKNALEANLAELKNECLITDIKFVNKNSNYKFNDQIENFDINFDLEEVI